MAILLICFAFFMILITAQPNYQQRVIYYSQTDNVCRFGYKSDSVNLIINLDDTTRIRRTILGNTNCWEKSIITSENLYLEDINKQEKLQFHQQTIKKYSFGNVHQIILNATSKNPASIHGIDYNCNILGDGTYQHFGTNFTTNPAEIYVRCLSIKSTVVEILEINESRIETSINTQ